VAQWRSGVLVTIVKRVTKFTLSAQVDNKSAAAVTKVMISLLKPFKDVVHSITADNGKELACHGKISKALSTHVYFAHPYSP
jgi:IS30 family transposase